MGITAKEVLDPTWYQPDDTCDTEFLLQPLSDLESIGVKSIIKADSDGDLVFCQQTCTHLLTYGLKGWRKFPDKNGEDVPFSSSQKDNLKRLESSLIYNLAVRIYRLTWPGEDDKKKSQSQPT